MEIKSLNDLLLYLAGPGAMIIVAWLMSWGLERFQRWHELDAQVKSITVLVVSVLIGVLARLAMNLPAQILAGLEPFVQVILSIIAVWLTTQVAHVSNPFRQQQ